MAPPEAIKVSEQCSDALVELKKMDPAHEQALKQIEDSIEGKVLLFGTDLYKADMGKAWNLIGLFQPTAIVHVANVNDVATAVKIAAKAGLTVAVASGRHSNIWAGRQDGAVVIDLGKLNAVHVDSENRTVSVEGGALLSHLDEECAKHKLHTTAGHNQTTGIGGFTLGGGFGYLARTFGMTVDNLISAQIVTASGDVVEASETSNPDLFWALRGGGGNFGIVTRFTLKVHPVDRVWFCNAAWAWETAEDIMEYIKEMDWATNLCEEASVALMLVRDPRSGQPVMSGMLAVIGETEEDAFKKGREAFQAFFEKFPPIFKSEEGKSYLDVQRYLTDKQPPGRYFERGCQTNTECREMVALLKDFVKDWKFGMTFAGFLLGGGAIRRKQRTDTAWHQRDVNWWILNLAKLPDDMLAEQIDEARELMNGVASKLDPYRLTDALAVVDGVVPNRSIESMFGENAERLFRVKEEWDPQNVFCHNRNIKRQSVDGARNL